MTSSLITDGLEVETLILDPVSQQWWVPADAPSCVLERWMDAVDEEYGRVQRVRAGVARLLTRRKDGLTDPEVERHVA